MDGVGFLNESVATMPYNIDWLDVRGTDTKSTDSLVEFLVLLASIDGIAISGS